MRSCSSPQSGEVGFANNQNEVSSADSHEGTMKREEDNEEVEVEEKEEEDEDTDFNPFLRETPSHEASSSLSSEIDGLDVDVVNSGPSVGELSSKLTAKEKNCGAVDSEHGEEEIILQPSTMVSQSATNQEKHNNLISTTEANGFAGVLSNTTKSRSPIIDIDNEDAICMRTRARYSLASFTLDELETFLQGTDDDDDLQNADDEEEYRKFLAAVLQGGDADCLSSHENENPDDEDEDNDADFEIELEELLESDVDENAVVNAGKEYDGAGRRPETRQNKRRKVSAHCEKKTSGQVKRPLRPILPSWHNGPLPSGKGLMPEATFQSPASGNGPVNGFTPQQIGQLHCLIHEHVQLLIQVFSLSVLEPSQKQIASQVQGLLFELLHKRGEALALKRAPYPSIYFTPSYASTSGSNVISRFVQGQCNVESVPQSNQSTSESSLWVPFVRGPLHSILDVSPLNLVGRYVDDIYSAAQEFRKRYIESGFNSRVEKEPLFPFASPFAEANSEVSNGTTTGAVNTVSTSPGQQPKKTLAAMLLESTKESIALVPKDVAKLAQRFLPLFNPALFPHKPPPAAVVNRVLFTDSEDELLALGMMEYNTDWKAIQQRFLPCKSKHQIFVRQKNRCSSKAPENPIKAVRKMKTSPLTAEEIACIQEGIRHYKFDWMLVWQYIVPHRDPSLLPRQWRTALGTQKSYKQNASTREQRKVYESKRRKLKAAASESCRAISDKEDCEVEISDSDNCMDYSDDPYVHQAFLADWGPDTSTLPYSERISSMSGKAQDPNSNRSGFPSASNLHQLIHTASNSRNGMKGAPNAIKPTIPGFDVTSSCKYYCRPYRARRVNNTHLVKLAPDLPPLNLPPSVRVVSQSAFKGFQCGTSKIYPSGGGGATACRKDNSATQIPRARPVPKDSVTGSQLERSGTVEGNCTDLQMHPLLFQVTEDINVRYHHPLMFSSGTSSSLNLFSGTQPQLNLSLFHSSQQQSHIDCSNKSVKSKDSTLRSSGIDFHPLMQKSNDTHSPTSFDAIQAESHVASDVPAIANRSSGLGEKSNELDLEIHLSSASAREKSVKSRQLKAHDSTGSKTTAAVSGKETELQENIFPYSQHGGKYPSASSCEHASSALPSVDPNDNITRHDVDDIGDQSHPGIVMEQEELSDSEEDIEENVEFECEEMADSDGEDGSGCEQAPQVQNKEVPTSPDENDPRANSDTQADNSLLNGINTSNMDLTGEGNDGKSNSSWLSLDSYATDNPVPLKMDIEGGTIGGSPASKNFTVGKLVTEERNTTDMVQQPTTGPLVTAKPHKPRTRTSKSNANLNIGLSVERSSSDG